MLVRIRSKDGNFRFELNPTDDISRFVNKIVETTIDADPSSITISNQPRGNETPVSRLKGRTLRSLGLKHGDLVFVGYKTRSSSVPPDVGTDAANNYVQSSSKSPNNLWETVQEHPVDMYWRSRDGKIPKGRDTRLCKHGPNGMCDYCMPLEPYDAAYQAEHSIKHLSFHAYLRKLSPKTSLGAAQALPPLSPISYRVKVPCPSSGHPPWPAGICTACQPSAITLQSQPFRMVDHLEIASQDIVERFLQAWRATGLQRFGWLLGHYEPYDKVPMGIKAVVEAIHEPPQEGELDGLTLGLPWEDEPRIRELAKSAATPLTIVGYIFTDLEPTPEDRTKNVYKRHSQSFFVSSLEAIFAATIQNANRTPSRSSSSGYFGSRMVTAILTATEDGQVDISAYQASEQACAMVDADMIEASVEPGIVRVKEEDTARYVPDVFYRYKNEYGIDVKKSAKPCFPVEYLLVNVGAPSIQESRDLSKRIELAKWLSDWHLIAFLDSTQLMSKDDIKKLVHTATLATLTQDSKSLEVLLKTEGWQTLVTFAQESAPARPSTSAPTRTPTSRADNDIPQEIFDQIAAEEATSREGRPASRKRVCPHCTFENGHGGSDCELCGLPLA
ncbi:hypothetical protein ID866_820 [Astraeus odoratus]|nr:hypothetical protein ID866_820 [Astraeus odoratus]